MSGQAIPQPPRFRLAICGGGVGGLTLACTLGRYVDPTDSIEVTLYEAGPEITTIGAGISVWSRTWEVMCLLGLEDELAKASVKPPAEGERPGIRFRRSDRPEPAYTFHTMMISRGGSSMHRADMIDVLVRHVPSFCKIRTSKRLVTYTGLPDQDLKHDAITLHFEDGTTEQADVLVGADGIKSATRTAMYNMRHAEDCSPGTTVKECEKCKFSTPYWTGTLLYRFLFPSDDLVKIRPDHRALSQMLSWSGKNKHIISYPVSRGQLMNCGGFVTIPGGEGTTYPHKWVRDVSKEELLHHYKGWEPELQELLGCTTSASLWAIHIIQKLPFWVSGRVALIGDAAHAMETHFGAGAGQAIEDAFVLGRLLADRRTSLLQVPSALKAYESVRRPFAEALIDRTRVTGLMYEFNGPGYYDGSIQNPAEERLDLEELGEQIRDKWSWQWKTPFEADLHAALAIYEQEYLAVDGQVSQEYISEKKSDSAAQDVSVWFRRLWKLMVGSLYVREGVKKH